MSNKKELKSSKPSEQKGNEIKLQDGEGNIINGYLKKVEAMFSVLSENGRLAFFHLIIDSNKELNEKRNEILRVK